MITPTVSCIGEATWNTFPNASGEGLPPVSYTHLIVEMQHNVVMKRSLISLQGQGVVAALIDDLLEMCIRDSDPR